MDHGAGGGGGDQLPRELVCEDKVLFVCSQYVLIRHNLTITFDTYMMYRQAPNLRTVNIQRISSDWVGFVTKRATASAPCPYANSNPVSLLYTVGKYKPGETVEQWRAEGSCVPMELGTILDRVPHYSIAETVATVRLIAEKSGGDGDAVSDRRTSMGNQSHFTELVQKTRVDLENGRIGHEELEACLGAWTFQPQRMERMDGGPDAIMWSRWEWLLSDDGKGWAEAKHILPY